MREAFHQGGWGMYPTTIVGLFVIIAAARYAMQPDRRRLAIVRTLSVLTFLVATLGFVTGVIRTFISAAGVDVHELGGCVVAGVGESLNNLGLGLVLLVIATLATVVGRVRSGAAAGAAGAELTDPHAR
jgi:hypothetical protein